MRSRAAVPPAHRPSNRPTRSGDGGTACYGAQPLRRRGVDRPAADPARRRPPPRRHAAAAPSAAAGPDALPVQGLDVRARPSHALCAWGCPARSPHGRIPVPCVPHERTGSLLLHHPDESPGSRRPAAGSRGRRRSGGAGGRTGPRPARAGPATGSTGAKPLLQPSCQGYQSVARPSRRYALRCALRCAPWRHRPRLRSGVPPDDDLFQPHRSPGFGALDGRQRDAH